MTYNTGQYGCVEKAAYELYVQEGMIGGADISNWFHAGKMILEKSSAYSDEGTSTGPKSKKTLPKSPSDL